MLVVCKWDSSGLYCACATADIAPLRISLASWVRLNKALFMLDWLTCFAFNWFQRDLCLQLNINIRCRRNSAKTLSVEFAAKSFFPISPEIKKTDSRRRMYFGDPVDAVFQPLACSRSGCGAQRGKWGASLAPPSKVLQWNKHSQKPKSSIPDQNIQQDVKKNTKRTSLDFPINQIWRTVED